MGQPTMLHCGAACGRGVWEGTISLAGLPASFQSLSPQPPSKLGPSGADSQVCGFVYILRPCGSLQWTLLLGWEFLSRPLQPPQVFPVRGFEVFFPCAGTLDCTICLAPQLFFPGYQHANVGLPGLPAAMSPIQSSSHCLATAHPFCPGCPSRPLLAIWMNVSSTPWLLDFHTVQFSGSSGYLFLNLLLSFFRVCEEAKCIYLHLHLSRKLQSCLCFKKIIIR